MCWWESERSSLVAGAGLFLARALLAPGAATGRLAGLFLAGALRALGAAAGPLRALGAALGPLRAPGPALGRVLLRIELLELRLLVGVELVLLLLVLLVVVALLVLLQHLVVLGLERSGLVLIRLLLARGQLAPHLADLHHGVLVAHAIGNEVVALVPHEQEVRRLRSGGRVLVLLVLALLHGIDFVLLLGLLELRVCRRELVLCQLLLVLLLFRLILLDKGSLLAIAHRSPHRAELLPHFGHSGAFRHGLGNLGANGVLPRDVGGQGSLRGIFVFESLDHVERLRIEE